MLLVSTAYPALTQFGRTLARAGTGDQVFAAVVGPHDVGSAAPAEESDLLDFSGLELASRAGFDGSLGVIDAGFIQTGGDGGGGDGGLGGV